MFVISRVSEIALPNSDQINESSRSSELPVMVMQRKTAFLEQGRDTLMVTYQGYSTSFILTIQVILSPLLDAKILRVAFHALWRRNILSREGTCFSNRPPLSRPRNMLHILSQLCWAAAARQVSRDTAQCTTSELNFPCNYLWQKQFSLRAFFCNKNVAGNSEVGAQSNFNIFFFAYSQKSRSS